MRHDGLKMAGTIHCVAMGVMLLATMNLSLFPNNPARPVIEEAEREVHFETSDGWKIVGLMRIPKSEKSAPGVIFVPASSHEIDAYDVHATPTKPGLLQLLYQHGVATLRIDIRGRGRSREPRAFHSMAIAEQKMVRLDVKAAIDFLASQSGVDAGRIGVVAEQDSADAAVMAGATDSRVVVWGLISGRLSQTAKAQIAGVQAPILCIVGKEDERGLRDMVAVYLSSRSDESRLRVFEGVPLGSTMFSMWRFTFPEERPIDELLGLWLTERLNAKAHSGVQDRIIR